MTYKIAEGQCSKRRIHEIDILKGIAIILVVAGHVVSQVFVPENHTTNPIFVFCYSFHMPLFTFLSGFVCRLITKIEDPGRLGRRCLKMIVIYIPMLILFCLYNHSLPTAQILISATPFWYLIFVVIADSVLFLSRKSGRPCLSMGAFYLLVCIVWFACSKKGLDVDIVQQLLNYFPFYACGAFAAAHRDWITEHPQAIKTASLICAFLFPLMLVFYRYDLEVAINMFQTLTGITGRSAMFIMFTYIIFAVPAVGIMAFIGVAYLIHKLKALRCLERILLIFGRHTLLIYLFHSFLFVRPTGSRYTNALISFILALTLPTLAGCAITMAKKQLKANRTDS